MQVDGARHIVGLDGAIARSHVQISVLWHANFDMQSAHRSQRNMESMGNARGKLDLISVLAGIDVQRLVQRVALIFNAEFNLLGVAGGDNDAAVVVGAVDVDTIGNRGGFGVVVRANGGSEQTCGEKGYADECGS